MAHISKKRFSTASKDWNLTFGLKKVEDGIVAIQDILPAGIGKLVCSLNPEKKNSETFPKTTTMPSRLNKSWMVYCTGTAIPSTLNETVQASSHSSGTIFFAGLLVVGAGVVWKSAYNKLSGKVVDKMREEKLEWARKAKEEIVSECHESVMLNKDKILNKLFKVNNNFDYLTFEPAKGVCGLKTILERHASYFLNYYKAKSGCVSDKLIFYFDSKPLQTHILDNVFARGKYISFDGNIGLSSQLSELNRSVVRDSIDTFCRNPEYYTFKNSHVLPSNPGFWELSYKITLDPWIMLPELPIMASVFTVAILILDKLGVPLKLGPKKKPFGFLEGIVFSSLGMILAENF